MRKRPFLAVTGVASLNGGGSVKTPTANVNDTSIINAAWARNLIQSYGLGAGIGTAPSYTGTLGDLDATGFYTLSGTYSDAPSGYSTITGQILHMQRRFAAGTQGFQLLPLGNRLMYRTNGSGTWSEWIEVADKSYSDNQYLKLTGGTLTGNLVVNGTTQMKGAVTVPAPTASNHAARKADVDALTTLTDDGVKIVARPDYNALVDPGFYHCNSTGASNGPGYAAKMIVLGAKGDTLQTQIAFPIYATDIKCPVFRNRDSAGSTWSEWRKLLLSESNEKIIVGDTVSATSTATKGTTPSGVRWSFLAIQDASGGTLEGTRLAMIGHRYGPDGSVRARVACYKPDSGSTDSVSIDVGYDANGNAYATAPATASTAKGQEIATASFVMEKHRRVHFCNRKLATRQTEKGT